MFCSAGRGTARWLTGSPDKDYGPLSLPAELDVSFLTASKHPGACGVAAFGIRFDPVQRCASIWPDSHAHSTRGPSNQSPHTPSPRSGFHKVPSPVLAEIAYTQRVLSWWLSITMDTAFCLEAVEEAIARYGKPGIFNTDQGSQGGFNRSLQHFNKGGCDGHSKAAIGSMWTAAIEVIRSTISGRAE